MPLTVVMSAQRNNFVVAGFLACGAVALDADVMSFDMRRTLPEASNYLPGRIFHCETRLHADAALMPPDPL